MGSTGAELDLTASDAPLWAFDHYVSLQRGGWTQARRCALDASPGSLLNRKRGDLADAWDELARADLVALHRAAGADALPEQEDQLGRWFLQHHQEWQALHSTIPGACMTYWSPAEDSPVEAMSMLVEGSLWWARAAALGWLLRQPTGGTRIREELRSHLGSAFTLELHHHRAIIPDPAILTRREHQLLRAAAVLNRSDEHPRAPLRTWMVARWLHGCLNLCGITGVVEVPTEASQRVTPADVLDPARFGRDEDDDGTLPIREVAIVAGLTFLTSDRWNRATFSSSIEQLLLPIALRPMRTAELEVEEAQVSGQPNALAWPADQPIAPPLAARRLLSRWGISWIARGGDDVFAEALERLEHSPERNEATMIAFWREGPRLTDERRARAARTWSRLRAGLPHLVVLMAAGVLEAIPPVEHGPLMQRAADAGETWSPALLDALCIAAVRAGRDDLFAAAMKRLAEKVANEGASPRERQNSMLTLMRRWEEAPREQKAQWRREVARAAQSSVVQQREELWRDVRRLGLDRIDPPSPAKAS